MRTKDAVGRHGEDLAVAHLETYGWQILARNWRSPRGELDIIAREGCTAVVVEVKTRTGMGFGHPAQAITEAKLARLRRLTAEWLTEQEQWTHDVRIDVIAIVLSKFGPPQIEHLVGVS